MILGKGKEDDIISLSSGLSQARKLMRFARKKIHYLVNVLRKMALAKDYLE